MPKCCWLAAAARRPGQPALCKGALSLIVAVCCLRHGIVELIMSVLAGLSCRYWMRTNTAHSIVLRSSKARAQLTQLVLRCLRTCAPHSTAVTIWHVLGGWPVARSQALGACKA